MPPHRLTTDRKDSTMDERTKAADEMFCSSCGSVIKAAAAICPKCGVRNQSAQLPLAMGKSRMTYILLGIFLGGFGVHDFYAGYTGRAIAQLLITILSCGFLWAIAAIWAIIELCTVRVDASGTPFVD